MFEFNNRKYYRTQLNDLTLKSSYLIHYLANRQRGNLTKAEYFPSILDANLLFEFIENSSHFFSKIWVLFAHKFALMVSCPANDC
jgi:hypothetical protein